MGSYCIYHTNSYVFLNALMIIAQFYGSGLCQHKFKNLIFDIIYLSLWFRNVWFDTLPPPSNNQSSVLKYKLLEWELLCRYLK